ncbi:MAG: polysaccharide deacetylase family protein [Alphaproteobacteria bacterium]
MIRGTTVTGPCAALACILALWAGAAAAKEGPEEAVRRALEANRTAADYRTWMQNAYAPHRLVARWARAGESRQRAACDTLARLSDSQLELFEQALLLSENALPPCRAALLERLAAVRLKPLSPPPPAAAGRYGIMQDGRRHCPGNPKALGTARVMEVAPARTYGSLQGFARLHLEPGELVFTFDDGPLPPVTGRVLAALEKHCVRATFFSVGRMASVYPDVLRRVQALGHVIGNHTWNHTVLTRLGLKAAVTHIEKGRAEIDRVLSVSRHAWLPGSKAGVAPFFRFPGLGHNRKLIAHVKGRGTSVFSCDICIDDWKQYSDEVLLKLALKEVEKHGRGIVLLHDIQRRTARILPALLDALAAKGYRAVHMVPQGWISTPAPRPAAQTVAGD